jgi:Glycine zipper
MKKILTLSSIAAVSALIVMSSCGRADTKTATAETLQPVATTTTTQPVVKKKPVTRKSTSTYRSPVMKDETQNTAKVKKGWSKAAKGAVIGGAGGAVIGAVINKRNRAAGAAIGGVIGAGGGYVLGRTMDKKDGRY